jgi:ABC-2 type transport system permease protein
MLPVFILVAIGVQKFTRDANDVKDLSLFPTATPFLMMLRMVVPPGPAMWQAALSVVLTSATVVAVVYAAGKIFRTGLLMQGKAATLGEMWKWVRADSRLSQSSSDGTSSAASETR